MDFLGFGGAEVLVILLLAVIVLGPERLARSAFEAGKLIRNIKAYFSTFNEELKSELDLLDDLKDVREELEKPLK